MSAALLLAALSCPPVQAEEIVIDDQDGAPWFTTTGDDWAEWGTLGYGFDADDTSYLYTSHTVGGSDRRGTATWTPDIATAGTYAVAVWFRRTENRTTDADHVLVDAFGTEVGVSIDQSGEGASGWVELGEMWCEVGSSGCWLTLDGDDDDASDEANAARFVLVDSEEPEAEAEDGDPCEGSFAPGIHTMEVTAGVVDGDDWSDEGRAVGEADGSEAHSPNVDEDELLRASAFDVCDPDGDEVITDVQLEVKARTQYSTGTYALELWLDAGSGAEVVFTGTESTWHSLSPTAPAEGWTWAELAGLEARVGLHDHPGGARDSDAWVDAFRLSVTFEVPEADEGGEPDGDGEPDGADEVDEGAHHDTGTHARGPDEDRQGRRDPVARGGCSAPVGGAGWWLALVLLGLHRRREEVVRGEGESPGAAEEEPPVESVEELP